MVSSVVQHSLQNGSLLSHFLSMQEVKAYRNKCINTKIRTALYNHQSVFQILYSSIKTSS